MNNKIEKKILKLRTEIREDYLRIQKNFQKIFLELDSFLENVSQGLKGGQENNGS